MQPILKLREEIDMVDYNYVNIKSSIYNWYKKLLCELLNNDEIILSQNKEDSMIIDFSFAHCIAQLSVTNMSNVPYKYVFFEAMDTDIDILESTNIKPIYTFYDNDSMQINDVIKALDDAIIYCRKYKVN